MENKNKLFNIPMRKELTVPSRHMMRFYNQVKNKEKRIKTQTIDTWSGLWFSIALLLSSIFNQHLFNPYLPSPLYPPYHWLFNSFLLFIL